MLVGSLNPMRDPQTVIWDLDKTHKTAQNRTARPHRWTEGVSQLWTPTHQGSAFTTHTHGPHSEYEFPQNTVHSAGALSPSLPLGLHLSNTALGVSHTSQDP